jgi:hypothetical protein
MIHEDLDAFSFVLMGCSGNIEYRHGSRNGRVNASGVDESRDFPEDPKKGFFP